MPRKSLVSQEVFATLAPIAKISGQISEVASPMAVQDLRHYLEEHQPQVNVVTPHSEEVLADNTVKMQWQVKDLPLFQNPNYIWAPTYR
ncbi:MAG: hypothetical protein HRU34_10470 [Richelia sp.]|nr:hypothetical protein [Richelia sp.]CDN12235.1 FHA domain containing protein [Richelia intracellularis]